MEVLKKINNRARELKDKDLGHAEDYQKFRMNFGSYFYVERTNSSGNDEHE
jgi:hypothetical protein